MSKKAWLDIVANAALFSDVFCHVAGLGFLSEVCCLRAILWQVLQQQVQWLWAVRDGDGQQTACYSSPNASSAGRLAEVEGVFSLSF